MAKKRILTPAGARSGYRMARADLLILVILTVINIALLLAGSETMMLFSIFVPYWAVAVAFYNGPAWFLQGSLIFACVLIGMYLLCWVLSKRHYGWIIAALVLFAVDTLVVIIYYWGIWNYGIMDLLVHAVVLYYLIRGVRCGRYLKHLPVDTPGEEPLPVQNTQPISRAEDASEGTVLAQAQTPIGLVCYRTVDHVNELVINGFVYDQLETLVETAHELRAIYDGHLVCAGLIAGSGIRYIDLDGHRIVQNL